MESVKVVVWHDADGTKKWMVSVVGASGRLDNETPYDHESDAIAIAKTIGRSRGCPVYRATNYAEDELIQA